MGSVGDLVFFSRDLQCEMTIRGYLKHLLKSLWEREEGFSGKRPFGNSDWKYDIYKCLIVCKVIHGALDNEGYISACDTDDADMIMLRVIESL